MWLLSEQIFVRLELQKMSSRVSVEPNCTYSSTLAALGFLERIDVHLLSRFCWNFKQKGNSEGNGTRGHENAMTELAGVQKYTSATLDPRDIMVKLWRSTTSAMFCGNHEGVRSFSVRKPSVGRQ